MISISDKVVQFRDGVCFLALAVVPNARKTEVIGEHNQRLKIKVQSPPVDGAANAAIIEFFSDRLKLPKKNFEIVKGQASRQKTLAILGIEGAVLLPLLSQLAARVPLK